MAKEQPRMMVVRSRRAEARKTATKTTEPAVQVVTSASAEAAPTTTKTTTAKRTTKSPTKRTTGR